LSLALDALWWFADDEDADPWFGWGRFDESFYGRKVSG
jgi:hypothetical protein